MGVDSFDIFELSPQTPQRDPLLTVVHGRTGVVAARLTAGQTRRRAAGYVNDVVNELCGPSAPADLWVTGDAEDVLAALGERGWNVRVQPSAVVPAALAAARIGAQREPSLVIHEVRVDYGD